jgi:hypothetical protein
VGAGATTTLGFGGIWSLKAPFAILASAGPQWQDGRLGTGFHRYIALGLSFLSAAKDIAASLATLGECIDSARPTEPRLV